MADDEATPLRSNFEYQQISGTRDDRRVVVGSRLHEDGGSERKRDDERSQCIISVLGNAYDMLTNEATPLRSRFQHRQSLPQRYSSSRL